MVLPKLLDESDVLERVYHTQVNSADFPWFIRGVRKFALRVSGFDKAMPGNCFIWDVNLNFEYDWAVLPARFH
jgi:hypothetical protein